ncbi:MAG: hypothetical protein EBX52_03365 [Proteobacteria bacterium]|nr:hypothetical protein [Pseudomonadota bacterium]
MKSRSFAWWLVASSILFAGPAFAATRSVNVQLYNPSTSDHFVILEDGFRSEWPKTAKFYFGSNYNFVQNPLVAASSAGVGSYALVESLQTFDFFVGAKMGNNFGIFAALPVHYVSFSGGNLSGNYSNETSMGDLKLMSKIRLTDDGSNTAVALIPEVRISTGGTEAFVSDGSTYLSLRGTVERVFESWTMVVNLGYVTAANSYYAYDPTFEPIDFRRRFIAGVGGYLPFNDNWGMSAELNTINMVPFDKNNSPNDFYLGGRYTNGDGLSVTTGIDLSRIGGTLGQDIRMIAGIRYTLMDEESRAPQPLSAEKPAEKPTEKPAEKSAEKPAAPAPGASKTVQMTPPAVEKKAADKKAAEKKPVTAPAQAPAQGQKASPSPTPAKKK